MSLHSFRFFFFFFVAKKYFISSQGIVVFLEGYSSAFGARGNLVNLTLKHPLCIEMNESMCNKNIFVLNGIVKIIYDKKARNKSETTNKKLELQLMIRCANIFIYDNSTSIHFDQRDAC